MPRTYHHAQAGLLAALLLLNRLVEDNVQEDLFDAVSATLLRKHHGTGKGSATYIVSPENANDLAASVQLHE